MGVPASSWNDKRVGQIIGVLLRIGVSLAAGFVVLGGAIYLVHDGFMSPGYGAFHGEPSSLSTIGGIINAALSLNSRGLIQFGLLLLIATPVARVAFSLIAFALERDYIYVVVTVIVLAILLYSLTGGLLAS